MRNRSEILNKSNLENDREVLAFGTSEARTAEIKSKQKLRPASWRALVHNWTFIRLLRSRKSIISARLNCFRNVHASRIEAGALKAFLDAYERARAYPHQRIETQNTYRWYSTKFLISIFGSGERINYIDSVRLTRNCANGNFLSSSIPCSHRYGIAMAPFNGC